MSRNEDAEDSYVDKGYNQRGSPFHAPSRFPGLRDDRNAVDDDLHQELDLKDPEEEIK